MNTSPDHPDFTALALGEHIHGTPAQAVLEALRTSVAARMEAEQIQMTARELTFVLKGQPPLRLDAERRNYVLSADPEAVRAQFEEEDRAAFEEEPATPVSRPRPTWIYPTLAAAGVAVAAFVALRLLPGYTPSSQRNGTPVAGTGAEPDGKIMVTPAKPHSGTRVQDPVRTPSAVVVKQEPTPQLPPQTSELPARQDPPVVVNDTPPQFPVLPAPPAMQTPLPYASPPAPQGAPSGSNDPVRREPGRGKKK